MSKKYQIYIKDIRNAITSIEKFWPAIVICAEAIAAKPSNIKNRVITIFFILI